ncbi:MAG: redoxin domain-containing protein [Fimbriimonadaceae bacterium]
MAITIGSLAPDFSLKSANAEGLAKDDFGLSTVKLGDYRGKKNVVLLFFPGVFTPPCTQEMCTMSEGINDYKELGAEVLGISVDSALAQRVWAEKENIKVKLLSDYEKKTVRAYDVVLPDFLGMGEGSRRAAFVIDREGVVRYAEVTPTPPEQPDFAAIKAALKSLS